MGVIQFEILVSAKRHLQRLALIVNNAVSYEDDQQANYYKSVEVMEAWMSCSAAFVYTKRLICANRLNHGAWQACFFKFMHWLNSIRQDHAHYFVLDINT